MEYRCYLVGTFRKSFNVYLIFFIDTKITNTFVSNMQNCKLLTLFDTGVDLDVGFITIAMCEVVRGVRRRKLE